MTGFHKLGLHTTLELDLCLVGWGVIGLALARGDAGASVEILNEDTVWDPSVEIRGDILLDCTFFGNRCETTALGER